MPADARQRCVAIREVWSANPIDRAIQAIEIKAERARAEREVQKRLAAARAIALGRYSRPSDRLPEHAESKHP